MKNLILIYLLLICTTALGNTFENGIIKGRITDEQQKPVPYATVMLKKANDSALYKGEMTDEDGNFSFEQLKEGSYFLEIQNLGFETAKKERLIISSSISTIDLGIISLKTSVANLKEVSVVIEKPFIQREVD